MKKLILFATILLASPFLGDGRVIAQIANEPGSGNCVSFTGTSQTINIGQAGGWANSSASIFSTEQWVMFNNVNGGTLMSRYYGGPGGGTFGWYIHISAPGQLSLHFNNSQITNTVATYTGIVANKWYHVATTYNGTTGSLYINGTLEATCGNSGGGANGMDVAIGSYSNTYCYNCFGNLYSIDGQIDEVRIWNRALTQTEIQTNMCKKLPDNYGNGLVGYWRFDEGVDNTCTGGQDACDASGNGNNGVKY